MTSYKDRNILRNEYARAVKAGFMTQEYAEERLKILERLFKTEDKKLGGS